MDVLVAAGLFANYRLPDAHSVQAVRAAAAVERSGCSSALVRHSAAVEQLRPPAVAARTYDYFAVARHAHCPEAVGHFLFAHCPSAHSPVVLVGVCRSVVAALHWF